MSSEQDVSAFVRATFRSVWTLELLCHLRKHPDRAKPLAELVAELRASDLVVQQSADALLAAGLVVVEAEGAIRYSPASAGLDTLAAASEALYARSPDSVRRMIVAAANPGITAFADAFRLRKD